jgi:SAM-dependent methyltransferase
VVATSRSFDRAAPFYDQTRGLPETAMAQVTAMLAGELVSRGRCLEIGVGTGRIALPLHGAGVDMTGVDLSRPMMDVLVDKAGGEPPFLLVQADATQLPFPGGRFSAAVASHVFHLIPSWRDAITELCRVLHPGGIILSSRGGPDDYSTLRDVRAHFRAELGSSVRHPGAAHGNDEVEDALRDLGATQRELPPVTTSRTTTVGTLINGLAAGHWSWTWGVPDGTRRRAAEATRAWARVELGPLDEAVPVEITVRWRAFDLP